MTSPSTSPENKFLTAHGEASSVAESSAMDITLIGELFEHCLTAASLLQLDEPFIERLEAAKRKLPPLQIAPNGLLQEWHEHFAEHEPGHRHVSHLYGLYPGTTINQECRRLSLLKRDGCHLKAALKMAAAIRAGAARGLLTYMRGCRIQSPPIVLFIRCSHARRIRICSMIIRRFKSTETLAERRALPRCCCKVIWTALSFCRRCRPLGRAAT